MTITITLKTDNEAFADDPLVEVSRLVHHVAALISDDMIPNDGKTLMDYNGNTIGRVTVKGH